MGSFDEEWAQLQAAAREETAHMQLNSLDGGGSASSEDFVFDTDELTPLGQKANQLAGMLERQGQVAVDSTREAGEANRPALQVGQALIDAASTWSTQEGALQADCTKIAIHMQISNNEHVDDEEDIRNQMARAQHSQTLNQDIINS
jgi:hypothetical protein